MKPLGVGWVVVCLFLEFDVAAACRAGKHLQCKKKTVEELHPQQTDFWLLPNLW